MFCIYILVMPKYWGGNYFAHGSFPEVGQKQKTEEKKKRERRKKTRKLVITMVITMTKHAWRTQAAWAKISFLGDSLKS